ncbi:MAG: RluA family pseudouridine synthase [Spirochaetaceae bacterium]
MDLIVEYDGKIRIDRYISESGILTRNQLKERELVVVYKGKEIKHASKAKNGETYSISWLKEVEIDIQAEELPLDIIYEDSNTVVINKEQGVVVHPALGNYSGTLVQGLMFYIKNLSNEFEGDTQRPGIVHRLDKDTSGIIITAKNTDSLNFLATQFRDRTNVKEYLAIIKGNPIKKRDTIKSYLKRDTKDRKKFMSSDDETIGKYAETDYVVLSSNDKYSLVKLILKTGRTHQIRVHMKHLGHPIVGDPIYSRTDSNHRDATLMLHSYHLGINLFNEDFMRDFYCPLPERMIKFMEVEEISMPAILEEHKD